MIRFAPVWDTSGSEPLNELPLPEGSSLTTQLVARDVASAMVPRSDNLVVSLAQPIGEITKIRVNQNQISLSLAVISGNTVTISATSLGLTGPEVHVSIERNRPLTFTRLTGEIPPGLVLTPDGIIVGTLTNIPNDRTSYEFTIRASNGARVRDRSFKILVVSSSRPQTFLRASLPSSNTDESGTFDFVPLANLPRADAFVRTFEVTHPEGDEELFFLPSNVPDMLSFIEGPPPGVRLIGTTIRGTIAANAPAGRYLFRVGIRGQLENLETTFLGEIVVQDALATYVERPIIIEWLTAEGLLGDTREGYPLAFGVKAEHEGGAVSYTLAPESNSLPQGVRINSTTGDLEGLAPSVLEDTLYEFTTRASHLGNFVDRKFSFRVLSLYTTSEVLDVRLKLRNRDRVPMVARYRAVVDRDTLFRPTDPAFGLPAEPFIYLIKGVAAAPFDNALKGDGSEAITINKDYHGQFNLILGKHRHAVVRDSSGIILHEVVFRELHDPQAKAGGFSFTSQEVREQQVIHAQSRKVVYANSIRNARLDLVRDCSFPTSDPKFRFQSGPSSAESLPAWMTSQQTLGDSSSVIGYIPALVVAYVVAGAGEGLAKELNNDGDLAPVGRKITLDRYYLYTITYGVPTTFDGGTTVFDGPPFTTTQITLDLSAGSEEKPIQV